MDQLWASLDRDTQDYLVLLLDGAGAGLQRRPVILRAAENAGRAAAVAHRDAIILGDLRSNDMSPS